MEVEEEGGRFRGSGKRGGFRGVQRARGFPNSNRSRASRGPAAKTGRRSAGDAASPRQRGRERPRQGVRRGGGRGGREVREVREVWGAWARDAAARSGSSSSSGFSLHHPLPLPASPLTPPSWARDWFPPLACCPQSRRGWGSGAAPPSSLPLPAPHAAPARPPVAPVPHLGRRIDLGGAGAWAGGASGACRRPLERGCWWWG